MISSVGVIGAEIGWGQNKPGVEMAPDFFRSKGLLQSLSRKYYDVTDYGNVSALANSTPSLDQPEFGRVYKQLAETTQMISSENDFTLTIGGDHSVALGSIYGLTATHSNLGIIWVDAHGDINTPESSLTGHFHGMPVAGLLGLFRKYATFSWIKNTIDTSRFVYVGVRDLDPGERELIGQLGLRVFTMHDVREMGMRRVISEAIRWVSHGGRCPLHLSFDIDAVDPSYAPATGVPVQNGLSIFDVQVLAQTLYATDRLVSVDAVELNPWLANSNAELASSWLVFQTLFQGLLPARVLQSAYHFESISATHLLHE